MSDSLIVGVKPSYFNSMMLCLPFSMTTLRTFWTTIMNHLVNFLACLFFEEKMSGYCDTLGVCMVTKLKPYLITQKPLKNLK